MNRARLILWGALLIGATPALLWAHRGEEHPQVRNTPQAVTGAADVSAATTGAIAPPVALEGIYFDVWFEPPLFSLLLTIWVVYLLGVGPLRAKLHVRQPFPWKHAASFTAGLTLYYLAVASSLDEIGEVYLFTAHMLQHNIMTYVVPLLILFGLPVWFADSILEAVWLKRLVGFFTAPVVAFGAFNLALVVWHVPAMYEWALRDKTIHDLEHATFILSALMMWWPIYSPSAKHLPPIPHYGLQMLYIFGLAVLTMPMLTFLCFSTEPHYPTYIHAPRITAMSPMEDQFVGGVVMKVSALAVYLASWSHIFFRWAKESASPTEPVPRPIQ